MKYKVLIVDDEEPARELLRAYVQKIEALVVVGVESNALAAKTLMKETPVDILLTDIQMEDLSGIDLVKMLKNPPITIFTTAYSEYALDGFELDIADYLVKPISFQRFCKALDKAMELCEFVRDAKRTTSPSNADHEAQKRMGDYFFVKTNRKMVKVRYQDLLFIQSFGEYVKLFTKDDVILALQTTDFMEKLLPAENFIRIHRSHIVNVDQISEISGKLVVIGQHRLTVSKRMKEKFMQLIRRKGII